MNFFKIFDFIKKFGNLSEYLTQAKVAYKILVSVRAIVNTAEEQFESVDQLDKVLTGIDKVLVFLDNVFAVFSISRSFTGQTVQDHDAELELNIQRFDTSQEALAKTEQDSVDF